MRQEHNRKVIACYDFPAVKLEEGKKPRDFTLIKSILGQTVTIPDNRTYDLESQRELVDMVKAMARL